MDIYTKHLSRFTALLVTLGLLLGLTVTGCSDKHHDGGTPDDLVDITYKFLQLNDTAAKTTLVAETVVLSAYDDNHLPVAIEQTSDIIADHHDVTPPEVVDAHVWEGTAKVSANATKLVLTYFTLDGKEVGAPDVITGVLIKENASLDFTSETEPAVKVTWDPADSAQPLVVKEVVTIAAKDDKGHDLTVELLNAAEDKVSIDGADVTGLEETTDDETADITAIAYDAEGKELATKTYNFTVLDCEHEVTWNLEDEELTIEVAKSQSISAIDEDGNNLTIELIASTNEVSTNEAEFTGVTPTAEDTPVTVTATAKNGKGKVYDINNYKVTVIYPVTIWEPDDENPTLSVGKNLDFKATDENGNDLTIELTSEAAEISRDEATITGLTPTADGAPAIVTATAKDQNEYVLGIKTYNVKVVYPTLTWSPTELTPTVNVGKTLTVSAQNEDGQNCTIALKSESTAISINGTVITGVTPTATEAPATVYATATDNNNYVVGKYTYTVKVVYPTLTWTPDGEAQSLIPGGKLSIGATDEERTRYSITVTTTQSDIVSISGADVTAIKEGTATVTAIAKTSQGIKVGDKTYTITVATPKITWNPSEMTKSLLAGKTLAITAKDQNGKSYNVTLESDSSAVTVQGNVITAVSAISSANVTATASDPTSGFSTKTTYSITVEDPIQWDPPTYPDYHEIKVGKSLTFKATYNGQNLTVYCDSYDTDYLTFSNGTFTGKKVMAGGYANSVTLRATTSDGITSQPEFSIKVIQ